MDFFGMDDYAPEEHQSRVGHLAMGPTRTEAAPLEETEITSKTAPTPDTGDDGPGTQEPQTPATSSGASNTTPAIEMSSGSHQGCLEHYDKRLIISRISGSHTTASLPLHIVEEWDGSEDNCRYCNNFLLAGGGGDCLNPACSYNMPLVPSTRLEWLAANRMSAAELHS